MNSKIYLLTILMLVLVSGCKFLPKGSGPEVQSAIKVYEVGEIVNNEDDVRNMVISNSEKIIRNTFDLYNKYPTLEKNPNYESFKYLLDSIGYNWQFDNLEVEFKLCCAGLNFWVGEFDQEKYVVTIKSSVTETREQVICNDPSETSLTNEATGETGCGGSGVKERRMLDINARLLYIVDNDGNVYFAGAYKN